MLIPEKFRNIGIFAPAGKLAKEAFQRGTELLSAEGKILQITPHTQADYPIKYLAGPAHSRAKELTQLWLNPETDLLLATRGGFGCAHLLPLLDWEQLAKRPEIPLIGYSDITALHYAMVKAAAGTPIVGPMLGKLEEAAQDPYTAWHFSQALLKAEREIQPPPQFGPMYSLKAGKAQGLPLPGNLAVSVTLAGTDYLPNPTGKILIFEDLNEPIYKLDRYLTQLEQIGFLHQGAGIIFGQFLNCAPPEELEELFREKTAKFKGPVLMNFPFGHCFPLASLNCRQTIALENERVYCC